MKIETNLDKINEALNKIRGAGGVVSIKDSVGAFSIKGVDGRFEFNQNTNILEIVVDDKPFLASDSMIENEINKFFN